MDKIVAVQRLKTILVIAVLAFWLPAINHCRLELIPGMEFLACCPHSEEEQAGDHHQNDCADDLCAQVEDGLYKAESNQIIVESPPAAPLDCFLTPLNVAPTLERASPRRHDTSPPELPKSWQFTFRAAAPPRAPTFVS